MDTHSLPLFEHALESPSAFTPDRLIAAVRAERALAPDAVPPLCVLDFDGDLSDHLAAQGISSPWTSWACFHTSMRAVAMDGFMCGIVPRTIGGPYAVLVAEQLWAAGARLIVGITSAGRVSPNLPLPSVVLVDDAIRDEGTSLHYSTQVVTNSGLLSCQRLPAPHAASSRLRADDWDRVCAAGWKNREAGGSGTRERVMPGCYCSPFECAANQQFNQKKVAQELRRYRQKGPGPTTRLLVDGIVQSAPISGTVLDIGSGVGALTFTLLERGASSAVAVDASAAYVSAARDEASQRGRADAVRFVHADFVAAA